MSSYSPQWQTPSPKLIEKNEVPEVGAEDDQGVDAHSQNGVVPAFDEAANIKGGHDDAKQRRDSGESSDFVEVEIARNTAPTKLDPRPVFVAIASPVRDSRKPATRMAPPAAIVLAAVCPGDDWRSLWPVRRPTCVSCRFPVSRGCRSAASACHRWRPWEVVTIQNEAMEKTRMLHVPAPAPRSDISPTKMTDATTASRGYPARLERGRRDRRRRR